MPSQCKAATVGLAGAVLLATSTTVVNGESGTWNNVEVVEPSIPRACVPPHDTYPFCDPKLNVSDRVANLVGLLTNEEKATLIVARESPKGNVSRLGIPEYDWGGNCIHVRVT